MTKTFTRIVILACSLFTTSAFAQPATPELLYYKFDGTGTSVPNLASAPPVGTNTATIMGAESQGSTGQCGGALIGTGTSSTNDYVNTGWATSLSGSWTISFWSNNVPSTTTTYYIFGDVGASQFRCFTGGVAGAGNWILRSTGIGMADVLATGGAATGPTMTTFVYNSVANTITSYVNAVQSQVITQPAGLTIAGAGPFKVGAYSASNNLPSGSLMDEFRVYNRALTVSEVQSLMNVYTTSVINPVTCASSYTAPSGTIYTTAGTYLDTIPNSTNCDSIITINLSFASASTATFAASSCGSYVAPSGAIYTTSGTYLDTIANIAGCDSIITINYTRLQATQSTFAVTACGMYTAPSGAMIMSSGTYMDTIPNMMGCDSVMTINVLINQPSASTMTAIACGMFTAPSGAMYTSSGTYMDTISNAVGCDSVITINLTVNYGSASSMTATACGSFMAPSGAIYTADGVYNDTIPNMAGCDSVITITLTIIQNSTSSITATACNSYTAPSGAVYTSSGTYMDTIPSMVACDSIITITLQITTLDTSVTVIGIGTLQATQSGATYQWLDCNNGMAPVAGATTQTWTPFQNGSYACIVTNGNCSDTSGCHQADPIGINESAFGSSITLYPNPNSGNFTINLGNTYNDVTVVITDLAGRVVYSHIENSTNMIPVQLDAAAGSYVITVTSGENTATFRMNKN